MRSRPKLWLSHWPRVLVAGKPFEVELTVDSQTETPVDDITLVFTGAELRAQEKTFISSSVFRQEASLGKHLLGAGQKQKFKARFDLPADAPPSYRGYAGRIEYTLEAHVDIPWWPDRFSQFVLPVHQAPTEPKRKPGLFSTAPTGPLGTELVLEVSLDDTEVVPGDVLRGVVALNNAAHHKVTRLVASLVADELYPLAEGARSRVFTGPKVTIFEGRPRDGTTYAFEAPVPVEARPSFKSHYFELTWRLQVRALISFGSDVFAGPAITVHPPSAKAKPRAASGPRRSPALGSERRGLIWAEVAKRCGLNSDADAERMAGTFGSVFLGITLELRDGALWSVAKLEWPHAGIDFTLVERRWAHAFKVVLETGDDGFDRRFALRGREGTQTVAALSREFRAALLPFANVSLDDEGGELASEGNGYDIGDLQAFVAGAIDAAKAADAALQHILAPADLGPHRAAWEAQAKAWGGTFSAGDFSIRKARYRDLDVELLTRFEGPAPKATVARIRLPAVPLVPYPAEVERVLASIRSEVPSVRIAHDAVELELPCPFPNPERAELSFRTLQRLTRAFAPET
jgi:Arrestin (or S-antigen), N-terminal domain